MFPLRYVNLESARQRYGAEKVDRLGAFLWEGDPLADEAVASLAHLAPAARERLLAGLGRPEISRETPEPLRCLFEQLHQVPFWVDRSRCNDGGAVFLRTGVLGTFVLAFRSLVGGYCSPAGNKPLAFSGRLKTAAARRLSETGRFVEAVSLPVGLNRGAPGFIAAARVRLMHAQVRRFLTASPRWDANAWGTPINQLDMAGTVLLFSLSVIEGLERLGVPLTSVNAEDLLHLWRHAGYLLGVREELLCATRAEAQTLWGLITCTQASPDADSVALATALIENPITEAKTPEERTRAELIAAIGYGVSRYLMGDTYADALGYPRNAWRFAAPMLRPFLSGATHLLRLVPGVDGLALQAGMAYWRRTVRLGLGNEEATFDLPHAVPGA